MAKSAAIRKSDLKSEIRNPKSEIPKRSPLELDRLIHERLRLGIISALAVNERLTFNNLKNLLQTTDGNLSVHARKLEEAHYISCDKTFDRAASPPNIARPPRPPRVAEIPPAHEALIKAAD